MMICDQWPLILLSQNMVKAQRVAFFSDKAFLN